MWLASATTTSEIAQREKSQNQTNRIRHHLPASATRELCSKLLNSTCSNCNKSERGKNAQQNQGNKQLLAEQDWWANAIIASNCDQISIGTQNLHRHFSEQYNCRRLEWSWVTWPTEKMVTKRIMTSILILRQKFRWKLRSPTGETHGCIFNFIIFGRKEQMTRTTKAVARTWDVPTQTRTVRLVLWELWLPTCCYAWLYCHLQLARNASSNEQQRRCCCFLRRHGHGSGSNSKMEWILLYQWIQYWKMNWPDE